ncbi:hypothetical protein RB608_16045 [Nocardioides sp. LHD-245]|uniref:P-loop ATPase, Sll1717 family n=1 Tax=Nocardioides sp. LHD-245 TaxID=3051387 RepID=UPI0027E1202A|nr:hypothetical protein [Nocardioides sp. LHD-245]
MTDEATALTKRDVLSALSFGARVAEDEREGLADYFIETDQWKKVISGQIDVIFGPKGAGKSAIYTSLMNREELLADQGVLLVTAEKPRGNTVFQGLVADPPTGEVEFVSIWKLYILSLLGSVIADYGMVGPDADSVRDALFQEGLLDKTDAPLASRFRAVWDWIKGAVPRMVPQGELKLDPATANPVGVAFKISLQEPSADERLKGFLSLDDLLSTANNALEYNDLKVWVLFDRLDVAFAESRDLEANGIRALFKTYLDMRDLEQVGVKIFLRTDIWDEVTKAGFREASHITRQLRIEWGSASLLHLVVRRVLNVGEVADYYGLLPREILRDAGAQRTFFDSLVPDQIDVGKNPATFEWILGRVQDGTKKSAPREVIHLLTEARDAQLRALDRGEAEPLTTELMSRAAFRESLFPVSKVRLEQTLYAEYPTEKPWIQALEGEKTEHTVGTLGEIWSVSHTEAQARAQRLVDIGFIEERGDRDSPTYWVPFLYRLGLNLRQGAA